MDNYRRPMYNRYNRNMGQMQNPQCGCGVTPVVDADNTGNCDKDLRDRCIDKLPLAMAYVPCQKWHKVLDASAGLAAGTIFQELVMPFYGDRNKCGMRGERS